MEDPLHDGAFTPNLRLIETMLWNGSTFPRLPLHMKRLSYSVSRLGWAYPGHKINRYLQDCMLSLQTIPMRVRLTLSATQEIGLKTTAFPPTKPRWILGLSQKRTLSSDPWLSIKSTRRDLYDQERASLPLGVDELLFINERDEICEGTITSVFFDRGEGLCTPPLSCGLLPGVLRTELECKEEILLPHELANVKLWVGNALRGLIPADFKIR